MINNIRGKLSKILFYFAMKMHPRKKDSGFLVKHIFDGWFVMNGTIIRQSPSSYKGVSGGFEWEFWDLPLEYQIDLINKVKGK